MAKTIHKILLHGTGETRFMKERNSKIISCGCQGKDQLVVWLEVPEPGYCDEMFTVFVYGTGWDHEECDQRFIGTVQDTNGYVWHIYEKL